MKKLVFLSSLVLATASLAFPAIAYAQTDSQVVGVTPEKACGTVTLTLTNNDVGDYGFTWTTGPFAGGPVGDQGLVVAPMGKTVSHTIRLPEDSFGGQGFVTLGVSFGPNTNKQPFLDLGLVDTDCDDTPPVIYPVDCEVTAGVDQGESGKQADAEAPCVSNSPGYEADEVGDACDVATGEPGAGDGVVTDDLKCEIPPVAPGFVDLDCGDFPLPDGRTAQQVLDATPGQDPHRLDVDDDRVACEIDETIDDGNDSGTDGDFDQVGELPTAIDTGRA